MQFNTDNVLYVRDDVGRLHRVTALFTDPSSANTYLTSTSAESVIAVFGSVIFVAASADLGFPFPNLCSIIFVSLSKAPVSF